MVSVYVPAAPLETLKVIVQLALAGMVALARVCVPVPEAKEPLHVLAAAGELDTASPPGSVFVKATWVSAYALELLKVIVSVDLLLTLTLEGANAAETVGATGAVTPSEAVAVAVLPPAGPVVSAFAGMLLV
jgi:hypothetical protein